MATQKLRHEVEKEKYNYRGLNERNYPHHQRKYEYQIDNHQPGGRRRTPIFYQESKGTRVTGRELKTI